MNDPLLIKSSQTSPIETAMMPRLFTIEDVIWETGAGDIFTWRLRCDDDELFSFSAGQFNMLYAFGVGEVPISISSGVNKKNSDKREKNGLEHTIRAAGSVTRAMQKLKPGDKVGLRGPYGSVWPVDQVSNSHTNQDLLIIAGGIGLAPLRPVIYHALAHRSKYANVSLLYGTRTPLDIIYRDELEVWQKERKIDVLITVDRAFSSWRGHLGVVTNLLAQANFDAKNTTVMLCGPEVMMCFAKQALRNYGVDKRKVFISLERNMKCALGHCGHCQLGPYFICKDGPIFRLDKIESFFTVQEL